MTSDAQSPHPPWYRLDIQGLRAIAILLVVAFHAGVPLPGGFTGVDVFFVISGYVITELILRQLASPGGFKLRTFYERRMRRLLPALAMVTSITVLISVFIESPFGTQSLTAATALGATYFVANFVIYSTTGGYFDAPAELNPLLNTWSLSVEEQFYFIFPALMLLAALLSARRARSLQATALKIVIGVATVSFALALALGFNLIALPWIDMPAQWAFYSSITRAWEFAAGAALALTVSRSQKVMSAKMARIAGLSGLALIALGAVLITSASVFPGYLALIPVMGTVLVIAAGTQRNNPISNVLGSPVLVWIGAVSYSWYLWHWPAIVFAESIAPGNGALKFVVGFGSILPAWASYRLLEVRIRRSKKFAGKKGAVPILASFAVPTILALGLWQGAQNYWWNGSIQLMADQVQPLPISYQRGCESGKPLDNALDPQCTWNADASGPHLYLVGDSQAGQLSNGLVEASTALQRPISIAAAGSCPFIESEGNSSDELLSQQCRLYATESIDWLIKQPPSTIVIGVSGNYFVPDAAAQLGTGLASAASRLREAGHQVVVLEPIPQFPTWSPLRCSLAESLTGTSGCGQAVPRTTMESEQALAINTVSSAASTAGAQVLNIRDSLCTPTTCSTNDGDIWRYRDMFHISVNQSEALAPHLVEALR